jgi:hypothetical protein
MADLMARPVCVLRGKPGRRWALGIPEHNAHDRPQPARPTAYSEGSCGSRLCSLDHIVGMYAMSRACSPDYPLNLLMR